MGFLSDTKTNYIEDVEFVKCPYCSKIFDKFIHPAHLKTHNKILKDLLEEFINFPTMTLKEYNYRKEYSNKGKENFLKNKNKVKNCYCFYHNTEECSKEILLVNISSSNNYLCDKCKNLNRENLDKRTKQSANIKRKNKCLEKYNVENIMQVQEIKDKSMNNQIEKYGGIGFASEELKNKTEKTIELKYGVKNYSKLDYNFRKEKIKKTLQNKYGDNIIEISQIPNRNKKISNALKGKSKLYLKNKSYDEIYGSIKSIEILNKKKKINLDKYKPIFYKELEILGLELLDEEYLGSHYKHTFKCKNNHIFEHMWYKLYSGVRCPICFPNNNGKSQAEYEIVNYLKNELNITNIIQHDRTIIHPKEIDIFLPDFNIAIEYCGLYYHSELIISDPNYHYKKFEQCLNKNIVLITIFEDEWIFKNNIVKERLKYKLNLFDGITIGARQCIIKEINNDIKNEFLNLYHIQGHDKSTIKLGAFYNNELVSVMTFSKPNIAKHSNHIENSWELNRFCIKNNFRIYGMFTKFISFFKIIQPNWVNIYSFCDLRWSLGKSYIKNGFSLLGKRYPDYWYVKNGKRIHRFNLRKTSNDPKNISEKILRISEGYNIIWGCGNIKFIMEKQME